MGKWKLHTGDPGHDMWDPTPKIYLTRNVNFTCLQYQHKCNLHKMDDSSVRLYDLKTDPEERSNVALHFPHVVDRMLSRLAEYNATAVPVDWPGPDENCNPALHGGYWQLWVAGFCLAAAIYFNQSSCHFTSYPDNFFMRDMQILSLTLSRALIGPYDGYFQCSQRW